MRFLTGPPPETHARVPDALRDRLTALAAPVRHYAGQGLYAPRWVFRLVADWPFSGDAILEESTLKRVVQHIQLSGEEELVDAYLSVARLSGDEAVATMLEADRDRYFANAAKAGLWKRER